MMDWSVSSRTPYASVQPDKSFQTVESLGSIRIPREGGPHQVGLRDPAPMEIRIYIVGFQGQAF